MVSLALAQFYAAHGQQQVACSHLEAAANLVAAAAAQPPAGQPSILQLRLHLETLRALCCLAWRGAGNPDVTTGIPHHTPSLA